MVRAPMAASPPAWLEDPGAVTTGATFRTVLYVRSAAEAVREAVVEIAFDLRMVYCVALEPPPPGAPALSTDVTVGRGAATVAVTFHESVAAGEHPGGIAVATVQWRCVGEGETRIAVRHAAASAQPWELRLIQRPR